MKVTLTVAHNLRAYDRLLVDVTADELAVLQASENADDLDEVLAGELLRRGHTISSTFDGCDEPFYNVLDIEPARERTQP